MPGSDARSGSGKTTDDAIIPEAPPHRKLKY